MARFTIRKNGSQTELDGVRPSEVKAMALAGDLMPNDEIRKEGTMEWHLVSTVNGLEFKVDPELTKAKTQIEEKDEKILALESNVESLIILQDNYKSDVLELQAKLEKALALQSKVESLMVQIDNYKGDVLELQAKLEEAEASIVVDSSNSSDAIEPELEPEFELELDETPTLEVKEDSKGVSEEVELEDESIEIQGDQECDNSEAEDSVVPEPEMENSNSDEDFNLF